MLTVEDEIAFGLENLQIPKEEMTEKTNAVLEKLRITHLKEKMISTLSGGQKQKVALACILAMEPELIILDEPTSLLDPFSAREFVHLMKDLQREKVSASSSLSTSLMNGRLGLRERSCSTNQAKKRWMA